MNSNNSRMVEIYELEEDNDNTEEAPQSVTEDQSSHCSRHQEVHGILTQRNEEV